MRRIFESSQGRYVVTSHKELSSGRTSIYMLEAGAARPGFTPGTTYQELLKTKKAERNLA